LREDVIVLDASVAVKAILPNALQTQCQALVQTFSSVQPAAPALWRCETTSAIAKAVHFGILTADEGRQALEMLDQLDVHLFVPDVEQNQAAFEWTLRLNRAAAYDSYYLALVQELDCALWTADSRLFNALKDHHLPWLHLVEETYPGNS